MHKIIRNILMNHKGKKNAIKSKEISVEMGLPLEDTQSLTREIIWETAEVYELPLVACGKGYYIAVTDAEIAEYKANIQKRIAGMRKTVRMVEKNYQKSLLAKKKAA